VATVRSAGVEQTTRVPGTPTRFLVLLCLVVVAARVTYVPQPLRNDEGGYLLVARQWRTGGEFLYGDYFVDRPPLLMLLFEAASLTEWDHAIRVLAIPFVLVFVLAGWRAGTVLGGPVGGRWAAVVAAGLMCSPGLGAEQADGELFGATLVMAAIALALSAWTAGTPARRLLWAGAAGAVAALAPLVKQNLLEGLLFLAVLVVHGLRDRDGPARQRARHIALAALPGALLPCALAGVWLWAADVGPAGAWHELAGFRSTAFDTIWSGSTEASLRRAAQLLLLGVVTGLLPLVSTWLLASGRGTGRRRPYRRTITPLVAFGTVAIAAGGSFWPSYLLQLAPVAVLVAGALAPSATRSGGWARGLARTVATVAVVGTVASGAFHATVPSAGYSERIGEWLVGSKEPGDTGFVAYGLPSVLETADMPSPYPYLWSVPMRTLDPDQTRLRATLAGPRAPEWIVSVTGFNAWDIDDDRRLRDLVDQHYRVVAEICGHPVRLRRDLTRQLMAPPRC
jgi:4-amino-4-deoxy-L-arabinose transferase-like glycosyltransferase